ncbi:MAG TPA: hypothetical protein PLV04_04555 [Phenylobacterium sp.]|jgi:hypothetical protein|uniref:hypothetical protein n=1 Tax=Phenylobacterium sp. TaxID=1871053 RepID=UPI002BE6A49B|nr:hypothetical protein [Phenylobacterium sp.]
MSTPIDPIRRAQRARNARRAIDASSEEVFEPEDRNLPVPVGPVVSRPSPDRPQANASAFSAHLMGQEGQKRGLRGGPETLDSARSAYVRTEWSGAYDRRARRGGSTKTEI